MRKTVKPLRWKPTGLLILLVIVSMAWGSNIFAGASPSIPEGYRGVSIPLAAHHFDYLSTDYRIDVLVTYQTKRGHDEQFWVTQTLLQSVRVAEVNRPRWWRSQGSILVALNPAEAEYVTLAIEGYKTFSITIRGKGDTEMFPTSPASFMKWFC